MICDVCEGKGLLAYPNGQDEPFIDFCYACEWEEAE
jgi:hypothetical protein